MLERNISEAEVTEVLQNYEVALPVDNDCTNFYKVIGRRRIRVTLANDKKTIVTLTEELP
jgi:translation initiation factor IF-1